MLGDWDKGTALGLPMWQGLRKRCWLRVIGKTARGKCAFLVRTKRKIMGGAISWVACMLQWCEQVVLGSCFARKCPAWSNL